MSELGDLYQELILDHGKNPRNFRAVSPKNREARGENPLCGDKLTLTLLVEGDVIVDIGFLGSGCAISTASASTMTEALKGKTVQQASRLFEHFHALVVGEPADADSLPPKLQAFSGVSQYPMRVKCATLAWHTLQHALKNEGEVASTE